ncbi:phosphodiester glycosidase family protein, partial [Patescibacteria group bacterium]
QSMLPSFLRKKKSILTLYIFIAGIVVVLLVAISLYLYITGNKSNVQNLQLEQQLADTEKVLLDLQNQDQVKVNLELKEEIENINKSFKNAEKEYQEITDLDVLNGKTEPLKQTFATILNYLAERNYVEADEQLKLLTTDIQKEKSRVSLLSTSSVGTMIETADLPASNTPPGAGYSRQVVSVLDSTYVVDIVAADMGSTRTIVDTATDGDCRDNCAVLSLSDYVSRNGAFAGINGSYFCPADYPSCSGKSNTFDTLAMNKDKKYINSDNNVYSTIPAVIFQSGSMRFVGQSLQWGRDTGVDGVLANQPLLLSGGNITFSGGSDPKQGSKGTRSFVGNKGSIAYIGVVRNTTVAEMAHVLKALGLEGALNLDSGGSIALWSGGYKAGPGRNIPNAILFVNK